MRGSILDFDFEQGSGVISGDNGLRYSFVANEFKSQATPKSGMSVDFEANDGVASSIYVISSIGSDVNNLLNVDGSEARKGGVYAAIGAGVSFFSWFPVIGIVLFVVGLVLEILGVKKLSDNATAQRDIFKNFILAMVLAVVGLLVAFFIGGAGIVGGAASLASESSTGFGVGMGAIVVAAIVYIGFAIASIIKMYKSLNAIAIEYGVSLMSLAAKIYVAGILLLPIFGIGYFLLLIFLVLKIVAYLKIDKN